MTHIYVRKLSIIDSDNGLSPSRRRAIIRTNAGILSIGPLGTNFSDILIEIHTFSLKKMHLKMSSGKWRPYCLGLHVLKRQMSTKTSSPASRLFVQQFAQVDTKGNIRAPHGRPSVKGIHRGPVFLMGVTCLFYIVNTIAMALAYFMMTSSNGRFSALLDICAGNSQVTGGFPSQKPVPRSFDVFLDLLLNKRLNKQSRHRWFETQSRSLWRHFNVREWSSFQSMKNYTFRSFHFHCGGKCFILYLQLCPGTPFTITL